MRKSRCIFSILGVLLILGAALAPAVWGANLLDGVWLKMKVTVKGHSFDPGTGAIATKNFSFPAYWGFVFNGVGYNVHIWTNIDGVWTDTTDATITPVLPGENFISDWGVTLNFSSTERIHTYHTPYITYHGSKVTYKATAEVNSGKVDGGTLDYYGYCTISGTSVSVSKLPFTP